ncbi:putative ribosomal protein L23 [Rosellinia necatrix]|uniref:Large ribosomal subunit protein uL23m n=1 Tax=Rosellinia necatrix TaxID=77044 RepID=A0A1W2TPW4_ROSNE|nr:putative ribosomal protein L23 [Rosellinia necatrix]
MAAAVAETAAATVTAAATQIATRVNRTFRLGTKQIYMPSHMITFMAPRKAQPPNFATFKVPLTFNKFDLRDYLLHLYKTPVLAVRSQLRQQRIRKSKTHGRIYRPPPIKTMTVQLKEPFVWPSVPEDLKPWNGLAISSMKEREKDMHVRRALVQKTGRVISRCDTKMTLAMRNTKSEATRLLREGGWANKRELDPRYAEESKAKKGGR